MKKGLKYGFAALAVLCMMGISLYTSNSVEAAKSGSATLKLTLQSGGDSTCTISAGGTWSATASVSEQANQTSTTTPILTCTFNNKSGETLKLAGSQLTGPTGSTPIPVGNVKTKNSCSAISGLGTCGTETATSLSTAGVSLFTKNENKIGTGTFTETLTLTIPAGQIEGTYNGTLTFTIS